MNSGLMTKQTDQWPQLSDQDRIINELIVATIRKKKKKKKKKKAMRTFNKSDHFYTHPKKESNK